MNATTSRGPAPNHPHHARHHHTDHNHHAT